MSTILIVDDDDPFRQLLRTLLEARGLDVLAASTPDEGLQLAAMHQIDAIVTDFVMPRKNGIQFCRAVRRQNASLNREVPVWIMTGATGLTENEAVNAGALGIFRKPFRVLDITKTIERHWRGDASVVPGGREEADVRR